MFVVQSQQVRTSKSNLFVYAGSSDDEADAGGSGAGASGTDQPDRRRGKGWDSLRSLISSHGGSNRSSMSFADALRLALDGDDASEGGEAGAGGGEAGHASADHLTGHERDVATAAANVWLRVNRKTAARVAKSGGVGWRGARFVTTMACGAHAWHDLRSRRSCRVVTAFAQSQISSVTATRLRPVSRSGHGARVRHSLADARSSRLTLPMSHCPANRLDVYRSFVADIVCRGVVTAEDLVGLRDFQRLHHINNRQHTAVMQEVRAGRSLP